MLAASPIKASTIEPIALPEKSLHLIRLNNVQVNLRSSVDDDDVEGDGVAGDNTNHAFDETRDNDFQNEFEDGGIDMESIRQVNYIMLGWLLISFMIVHYCML